MAKPVLITIDDDPAVLSAVQRDLRNHYGESYRVMKSGSPTAALEALRELRVRGDPVALIVADQRMPGMTGVDLLEKAIELHPDAKRVLLTAYADTDAAMRAINAARVDYYLLKPWDPPEQNLYPVLDDLLEEWQASYRPPFEGIRVVGFRWSPETPRVREFLSRNLVPYKWLDPESDSEARAIVETEGATSAHLPLVILQDGSRLEAPQPLQLAGRIGLQTSPGRDSYDLLIIGAGPAGLGAAVYGASEGLRTAIVEREAPGGQAGLSSRIENYLGFPSGVSGGELARRAVIQTRKFGAEILTTQEAHSVRTENSYHFVTLDDCDVSCRTLLIATGVSYRQLDVPGMSELTGAGVYYGSATNEAISCRDSEVYVVGGGNSAGQAALYLSRYARNVTVLVKDASLDHTMSRYLIADLEKQAAVKTRFGTQVVEVYGENHLESITVEDTNTGARETLPAAALFVFIGAAPRTEWLAGVVERDEKGFILSGKDLTRDEKLRGSWPLDRDPYALETSVPGIFVAGDVRHGSIKRVASGVGEGAVAVSLIHQYLEDR